MSAQRSVAIVVHYCAYDACIRCVRSLLAQSQKPDGIIVIDNDSPDGSGVQLGRHFAGDECVEVICSPENRGFAGGVNVGLALARKRDFSFAWIVNPDVVVDSMALSALLFTAAKYPHAAMFGSRVFYLPTQPEETPRIWGAGGVVDLKNMIVSMRGSGEHDTGAFEQTARCDYLPGCSLFVRLSTLSQLGYLPESYFLYFEETDWCMRARAKGYDLIYVPSSVVFHDTSVERMQEPMRVYYFNRSAQVFWWRWGGPFRRLKLVLRSLCLKAPQALWAFLSTPSADLRKTFLAHFLAHIDFVRHRRGRVSYAFTQEPLGTISARTETP